MPFINPDCLCDTSLQSADQWLFLGSSIVSFTASADWGSSVSRVTVQLKTDPEPTCNNRVKYYLDTNLNTTSTTLTDRDWETNNGTTKK